MFENLWQITMYGPMNNSNQPDHQEVKSVPGEEEKTERKVIQPFMRDADIEALEGVFGPLHEGQTIEMTLQEAVNLMNKTRRRIDAFNSITKRLKAEYGVCLKITSQKTKQND